MDKTFIIIAIVVLNIISFSFFGMDKARAENREKRIPERTLLIWAFFAPLGAFVGMHIFHHKTKKNKFKITVPLFLFLQIALWYYLTYYVNF